MENAPFSHHGEEQNVALILEHVRPKYRWAADIAAANGVSMSNTLRLFLQGWSGLAVEYDAANFTALARTYERLPGVNLARCKVTPDNVVPLLQANGAARDFDVLSLDIDSYDYFILERVLGSFRPSVIVAEVNEMIPPPIKFTLKYDPAYGGYANDHFQGQSLSQLMDLAGRHEYALVSVEYNNAFLVPRELCPFDALTAEAAWRAGYFERPERRTEFRQNNDVEEMYALPPAAQVEYLHRLFAKYAGKYDCSL